jgi:hypothetical protein
MQFVFMCMYLGMFSLCMYCLSLSGYISLTSSFSSWSCHPNHRNSRFLIFSKSVSFLSKFQKCAQSISVSLPSWILGATQQWRSPSCRKSKCRNSIENVEKVLKMWKKYWKCGKSIENVEKVLKMLTKYWKCWKSIENVEKVLKMSKKYWKCRKSIENVKKVLKMSKKYWKCGKSIENVENVPIENVEFIWPLQTSPAGVRLYACSIRLC